MYLESLAIAAGVQTLVDFFDETEKSDFLKAAHNFSIISFYNSLIYCSSTQRHGVTQSFTENITL